MAITMDSDIVMLAKKKTFQIGDGNKAIFETQEILRGQADVVVDPARTRPARLHMRISTASTVMT